MEAQLERTRDVVASLRELLSPAAPMSVSYRTVPPLPVLAMTDLVTAENCGAWLKDAYDRLYAAANGAGITVRGPSGATYAREIFEEEVGEVVAFVPVPAFASALAFTDVEQRDLPGGRFAITVHAGPFDDFDRTYGAQLKERTMSLTIAAVTFDSRARGVLVRAARAARRPGPERGLRLDRHGWVVLARAVLRGRAGQEPGKNVVHLDLASKDWSARSRVGRSHHPLTEPP